ncbi:MAG: outer membrane beta-barrel protein [Lewinellaceae bacterium]|nr:outer membrane beta-barrel protein [Lewinellaceae bacterium]
MKKSIIFVIISLFSVTTFAQHFYAGLLAGGSNYLGDLSENSSRIIIGETKLAGGLFAGYQFNDFAELKLGVNYARLSGSDANAKDELIQARNLSFFTNVFEFSLRGEWNIMGFQPYNYSRPFSPFIFGGIAGFKFDPQTEYLGQKVSLQPLGTEGQGMPDRSAKYKLFDLAFPFGLGAKYLLSENWTLGIEFGARYTLSDYVDDVGGTYVNYEDLFATNGELTAALGNREGEYSGKPPVLVPTGTQRGDQKSHDLYFIAGLTITYNFIDSGMLGSRKRIKRRKTGCPTD